AGGVVPRRHGHRGGVDQGAGGRRADLGDGGEGDEAAGQQRDGGEDVAGAAGRVHAGHAGAGRGHRRPAARGAGRREYVGHLLVHGRAGAGVADHDGVGGAAARHRCIDAVVLGDGQVGQGRQRVGVAGVVVAQVGVGRPGGRVHVRRIGQAIGDGGVDPEREAEGDGGAEGQDDGGGQGAAAALRAGGHAIAAAGGGRPGEHVYDR